MTPFSKVLWKEGAFLTQQHMQQAERHLGAVLQQRFYALAPYGWGVSHVRWNDAALAQGRLELLSFEGMLSDGSVLQLPERDPLPSARSLAFSPTTQSVEVFLGVPALRPRMPVSSEDPLRADVRYLERVLDVPDENDSNLQEPVEVGLQNVRLVVTGDALEGTVLLPIARVMRTPEGVLAFDAGFIPPCLKLGASPALMRLGHELVGLIGARSSSLSQVWQRLGLEQLPLEGSEALKFWYIYTLNGHVSVLEHLMEHPETHPVQLFEELLRLQGALSTFVMRREPGPSYRHERLGESFGALQQRLKDLLARLFVAQFEVIPLVKKDAYWIGRIGDERLRQGGSFYLAVSGDMPAADLVGRLPSACKLADLDGIGRAVRMAVAGVPIVHINRPPAPLPIRRDATYFRVQTEGPDWEAIKASGALAFYIPSWLPIEQKGRGVSNDAHRDLFEALIALLHEEYEPILSTPCWSQCVLHAQPVHETHYLLAERVSIPADIEEKVAMIADEYYEKTSKKIVITSGTRSPRQQAAAMYDKLLGREGLAHYPDSKARRDVETIFLHGTRNRETRESIESKIARAIEDQISRGVFISKHLRSGAVDIRTRDMTTSEIELLNSIASQYTSKPPLLEKDPVHLHLSF